MVVQPGGDGCAREGERGGPDLAHDDAEPHHDVVVVLVRGHAGGVPHREARIAAAPVEAAVVGDREPAVGIAVVGVVRRGGADTSATAHRPPPVVGGGMDDARLRERGEARARVDLDPVLVLPDVVADLGLGERALNADPAGERSLRDAEEAREPGRRIDRGDRHPADEVDRRRRAGGTATSSWRASRPRSRVTGSSAFRIWALRR